MYYVRLHTVRKECIKFFRINMNYVKNNNKINEKSINNTKQSCTRKKIDEKNNKKRNIMFNV